MTSGDRAGLGRKGAAEGLLQFLGGLGRGMGRSGMPSR